MRRVTFFICVFSSLISLLLGDVVETRYGDIVVEEQVILDLLASPAMQRMHDVYQYGIDEYIGHKTGFTRYDHSIGVFALLRKEKRSLEEQIAGLIHDVSHTAFSHLGDFFFCHKSMEKAYQDIIHDDFLVTYGVADLLHKYGLTVEEVSPDNPEFISLERPLPHLCADRIDYNLQGGIVDGLLTEEEMMAIYHDIIFDGEQWTMSDPILAEKFASISQYLTFCCWSSPRQFVAHLIFCDILHWGLNEGVLSFDDISFGTDKVLWERLQAREEPYIRALFDKITHLGEQFSLRDCGEEGGRHFLIKYRAVIPYIRTENGVVSLDTLSSSFRSSFEENKAKAENGWVVCLDNYCEISSPSPPEDERATAHTHQPNLASY